jgi:hypothetical protein
MHIARLETQTRHEGTLLKLTIPSAMLAELIEDGHMVDWRVTSAVTTNVRMGRASTTWSP